MLKKVLFVSVVFLFLAIVVFLGMAEQPLVDATAQLEQAEACMENRDYEQAEAIYKTIVTDYPGIDYALKAQEGLVMLYIIWGKQPQAEATFEELLVDFSGHPNIAKAVYEIADEYFESEKFEKAREFFQYVLDNWPGDEYAMWSRAGLARSNFALGEMEAADAAFEKLLTDFSGHPDVVQAVYEIADNYRAFGEYEKAKELYQYVIDNWAQPDGAIQSQVAVARSHIALGDDANAEVAIKKLVTEFSENKNIAGVLNDIAYSYRELEQYEKARELYQYVIENWPQAESEAIWSLVCLAKSNIALGDEPNAQTAIDSLIADFNSHPDLPRLVYQAGEEYGIKAFQYQSEGREAEAKDYYQKAKLIWERIIQELPPSEIFTPQAYYAAASCYFQLGEYEKAIGYGRIVVDNWPDYKNMWLVQFMIARCYEGLESSGRIPTADAAAEIRKICEKLLADYSNPQAVVVARGLLKRWGKK